LAVLVGVVSHLVARPAGQALGPIAWGGVALLAWLLGVVPHELGHALACVGFGRRVRAVGVGWAGAWVDTSDMFPAHGLVALAGPAASFACAVAFSSAARLLPGLAPVANVAADVLLAQGLLTGWPFLGFSNDGQKALGDLLREARLGRDSWRALRQLRPRAVLLAYACMTVATFLSLAVWAWG
jgi:hypothetical protein